MTTETAVSRAPALRISLLLVNIFYWFAWIGGGLLLVVTGLTLFSDFDQSYVWLPLEIEFNSEQLLPELSSLVTDGSLTIAGFGSPKVSLAELDGGYLLVVVPLVIAIAAALWLFASLRSFLKRVRSGDLFHSGNPALLSRIGWIVVVVGPMTGLAQLVLGYRYLSHFDIAGANIGLAAEFHWGTILAGLVIVVIAKVFAVAVQIKQDADLTV